MRAMQLLDPLYEQYFFYLIFKYSPVDIFIYLGGLCLWSPSMILTPPYSKSFIRAVHFNVVLDEQ